MFAACAYAHLLSTLGWKKPHGAPLSALLILAFVLLPELILLQLGFWLVPSLLVKRWREMSGRRFVELTRELGVDTRWVIARALVVCLNSLPLVTVFYAYRNRLCIRYHEAVYVGNLGLDHRNGWLSIAGLVAVGLTAVLSVVLFLKSCFCALVEDEGPREIEEKSQNADPSPSNSDFDWSSFTEVLYATMIHQILLGRTNHPVPMVIYLKSVPLLLVSLIAVAFLYTKRGVHIEVIARYFAIAIIAATVISQLGWDLWELYDVTHGQVEQYNYRWGMKDWFSAKGSEQT